MAVSAGTLHIDIKANLLGLEKSLDSVGKSLRKSGKQFESVGNSLTKALTLPLVAASGVALKAANDIGKAQRTIRASTGATGAQLKTLMSDFESVITTVAAAPEEAAKALGVLHTATGQTGKGLQDLTSEVASVSKVLGEDIVEAAKSAGQLFNAWGVTTEKQTSTLSFLYKVSQQTGASVTGLSQTLAGADEIFGAFNFSLEESAVLLGSFQKVGIDSQTVIGGLTRALRIFSKEGITDVRGALEGIFAAIKNSRSAAEITKSNALAFELFGKSAGADLAQAIRQGRFSIDELLASVSKSGETARQTYNETKTIADAFGLLRNTILAALAPLGQTLAANLQKLEPAIKSLAQTFASLVQSFASLSPETQTLILQFGALLIALGPLLSGFGNLLISSSGLIKTLAALAGWAAKLHPVFLLAAAGFAALELSGVNFSEVIRGVVSEFSVWLRALGQEFPVVAKTAMAVLEGIKNVFVNTIGTLKQGVLDLWNLVSSLISLIKNNAQYLSFAFPGLKESLSFVEQKFSSISERAATIRKENEQATQQIAEQKKFVEQVVDSAGGFDAIVTKVQDWKKGLVEAGASYLGINKQVETTTEVVKQAHGAGNDALDDLLGRFGGVSEKVDEATKSIQQMQNALADQKGQRAVDLIKKNIEEISKGGSAADFKDSFKQLEDSLTESYYNSWKRSQDKVTPEQARAAEELSRQRAQIEVGEYQQNISPRLQEIDQERHTKVVGFFQGLMEDVVTGTRFDFENQFKKAVAAIAAEWLALMIESNIAGAKSFGEVFSKIFDSLTGAVSNYLGDIIGIFGGSGGLPAPGSPGFIGPVQPGVGAGVGAGAGAGAAGFFSSSGFGWGSASGLQTVGGVAGAAYGLYSGISGWDNGTKGKGGAIGSVLGTGVGAFFGGPFGAAIGANLGKFAGEIIGGLFSDDGDPARLAREAAAGWFEERLKEAVKTSGGLKIFDEFGKLTPFGTDFKLGDPDRWLEPGWADKFWGEFGGKGADTFLALGEGLNKIIGGDENIGAQLGALLAEQLGTGDLFQNLDNIKLFMDSMGVSVEQLTEALFQMAAAGNLSWHEFEVMRMSLSQIPTEGLAAFGDMDKAFQMVLESGGRGIGALISLKNIAIEAGEAGVNSLEGLRASLVAAGYDTQTLDAFFAALASRGVMSLEELKNASDQTLAGVIADMESAGVEWTKWTDATEAMTGAIDGLRGSIDSLSNAIENLPDEKTISIRQEVSGAEDTEEFARGGVLAFASGGVVSGPTFFKTPNGGLGLMGESGPEAILPLKRINGKLGVSASGMQGGGGVVINVDASGAEAGVEHRILAAFDYMRRSVLQEAIDVMAYQQNRRVS